MYNLILSLTSDSPMCTKGLKYTDDEFVNDLQEKNIGGNLCKNEIINLNSTEKLKVIMPKFHCFLNYLSKRFTSIAVAKSRSAVPAAADKRALSYL